MGDLIFWARMLKLTKLPRGGKSPFHPLLSLTGLSKKSAWSE